MNRDDISRLFESSVNILNQAKSNPRSSSYGDLLAEAKHYLDQVVDLTERDDPSFNNYTHTWASVHVLCLAFVDYSPDLDSYIASSPLIETLNNWFHRDNHEQPTEELYVDEQELDGFWAGVSQIQDDRCFSLVIFYSDNFIYALIEHPIGNSPRSTDFGVSPPCDVVDLIFGYASAAYERFNIAQRLEDLQDSVQFLQEIQSYPGATNDKIMAARRLYATMSADHAYVLSESREAEDWEKSLAFWRQSVLATEPDAIDLAGRLFELGNLAFKLSGASEDWKPEYIAEACDAYERAVIAATDTAFIAQIHFELASTLHHKFLNTGVRKDFDNSVGAGTKACDLIRQTPSLAQGDPHWTGVYRHCVKLIRLVQENFKRDDKTITEQLESVIQLLRLIIPYPHQNRLLAMNRLGLAYTLLARIQQRGGQSTTTFLASLEKALDVHETALKETRPDDFLLHARHTFVGLTYYQLSDLPGIEDGIRSKHLDSSIDFLRRARLAGRSNLNGTVRLAKALERRYKLLKQRSDLDECVSWGIPHSEEGFRFGHSKVFLDAAIQLVEICHGHNLHEIIIPAYRRVFKALRRMTQLGLSSNERQEAIVYSVGYACDAAASALKDNQAVVAVELLEEGRNLFFSQLLPIQTDTSAIKLQDPDLALDLDETLAQLLPIQTDTSAIKLQDPDLALDLDETLEKIRQYHRATDSIGYQSNQVLYEGGIADDIDEVARDYNPESQQLLHYGKELERYIENARKLPGLSNFVGLNPFSHLKQAARLCPVVYLNISQFRCDALVIGSGPGKDTGVLVVPLPTTSAKVLALSQTMRRTIVQKGRGVRQGPPEDNTRAMVQKGIKRQTPGQEVQSVLRQLWDIIVRPVLLALDYLRLDSASSSNDLPHICWCPSGPSATFLPLHAAGDYARGPEHWAMTHIVSTYTPNISSLLRSLERESHTDARDARMLLISQPASPPNLPLPGVVVERDRILATFDETERLGNVTSLHDEAGRVNEVVKQLPSHEMLHLACHGIQDMVDPLESSVVLSDGNLTIREIIKTPLPKAELVYLSACQTATGSVSTPDESFSLAGSFLFAGYKGAVATMWSINDKDGCDVATSFYKHILQKDGSPVANAAFALHGAVQELLEANPGIDLIRWIPFVYFGVPGAITPILMPMSYNYPRMALFGFPLFFMAVGLL
ncbi:hypothetical protein RSAG8_02550, partial [Rhizoctonia solani AG-8 WAC10335]